MCKSRGWGGTCKTCSANHKTQIIQSPQGERRREGEKKRETEMDMEQQEHEHEVYGGEIPDEGEMDADAEDADMASRPEDDSDPNSKVRVLVFIQLFCL